MATATEVKAPSLQEQFSQLESLKNQFVESARSRLNEIDKERADLVKSLEAAGVSVANGSAPSRSQEPKPASPPRRRRRGGNRAEQFVKLVSENPGITVSEVARQMGIKPNYLYRISKEVVDKGEVVKDGRGYKVAA